MLIIHVRHLLTGNRNRQPDQELSVSNAAAWHDAEHILKIAKADVLLIFDCCYAGNLLPCNVHPHYPSKSFECIAACGRDKETSRPGETSFTTALIWSLKVLERDRKPFTTQELRTTIMKAPKFPAKQFVPLIQQDESRDQQLVIAPFTTDSNTMSPKIAISSRASNEASLDLRFWYPNHPDEEEIKKLAHHLRKILEEESISASRIGWLILKKRPGQTSKNAVEKWRTVIIKNTPVETMGPQARGPLLRGIQNTHPALGIVIVVVLALSICAFYVSPRSLPVFKLWERE
jgi:hypothetical protein